MQRGILALILWSAALPAVAPNPAKHAKVEAIKPLELLPNKTLELRIPIVVEKGFHIQSNPASAPQLIATVVEMDAVTGVEIGMPVYPPGKSYRLQGAPNDISTYDGKIEVRLPIKVGAGKPALATWKGKVRYQACNDQTCFFPVWEDFSISLR